MQPRHTGESPAAFPHALKKLALLVTTGCLAASAQAQSSVTMYGILDAGITYFSNIGGHSSVAQTNGVDFPSTVGFTGVEDLGGGNHAIFKLETAIKLTNGASAVPALAFNKQAFVGIENDTYGTVQLGRLRQFTVEMAPYVAAHGGIFGFHPGNYDQIVQSYFNNAASYESPIMHGVRFGAMYSFGSSTAPATNTGRAYGFRLAYQNGPFQTQAVMSNINGVTINPAAIGLPEAFGRSARSTIATGIALDNLTTASFDASYRFGPLQLIGLYSNTHMRAFDITERLQTGEAEAVYSISPALAVGGGYQYSVGMGGRWHVYNASVHYALSKRTLLYLDGEYQHVTGAGQKAALLYTSSASGSDQAAVTIGMRHSF